MICIIIARPLTYTTYRWFIDLRILPLLALIYSFALIDRINLGLAYTAGMGKELVCDEPAIPGLHTLTIDYVSRNLG